MKKIVVFALGVLSSTLTFAGGTEEPVTGSSSVTVLNSNGSTLFKVLYKAKTIGNVKVAITNEKHEVLFAETLKDKDGFIRPYNFNGLEPGTYFIEVTDDSGKQIERISYDLPEAQPFIHLTKLSGEESRYLLTGRFEKKDFIQVRIYNSANELVFDQGRKVAGQYGEVFNLKNIPGGFTFEVGDDRGVLSSVQH